MAVLTASKGFGCSVGLLLHSQIEFERLLKRICLYLTMRLLRFSSLTVGRVSPTEYELSDDELSDEDLSVKAKGSVPFDFSS